MTDDATDSPRPHPIQRLDGPEALLTAEWNVADLPWITPEEPAESGSAAPSQRVLPPPPPSQRRAAPTAFMAGAAAPQGATGTRTPLIARPKPRQPPLAIRPSVVLANDLGTTLPPRAEREAAASPTAVPKVSLPPRSSGRPLFVALGSALGCISVYALWSAAARPVAANMATERRLPQFLRESPAPELTSGVGSAAAPPAPSTLPPALAATLARALPAAQSDSALQGADAGPDAAPASLLEDPPRPSPGTVSAETRRRAEVLRATLEAQRSEPAAPRPASKQTAPLPAVARRPVSSKKTPAEPVQHAQVPAPRVAPALRPLTTYTYEERAPFAVTTAPLRVTDITLEAGETLVSQPTAGDGARWVITVVQGGDRSHVFVKPLRPGLRTNLTLTTNRRSYFLELSCRDDGTYMAGVAWQYPADDRARRREALAQAERERQSTTAISDLQALRFDYRIAGSPSWRPTMVFDDGTKTFIRFPRPVSPEQAPALFLLRTGSARDAAYVNYRIKGDLYVVDRLVEAAELRLGSGEEDPHAPKMAADDPRLKVQRPRSRVLKMGPVFGAIAAILGLGGYAVLASLRKSDNTRITREPTKAPVTLPSVPAFIQEAPSTPEVVPAVHDLPTPAPPPARAGLDLPERPDPRAQQALQQKLARRAELVRIEAEARNSGLFFASSAPASSVASPAPAAPPFPVSPGAGLPGVTPAQNTDALDPNLQLRKNAFLDNPKARSDYLPTTLHHALSPYEIKATTIIPATLITGISRRLQQAREEVAATMKQRLQALLGVTASEFESLLHLVQSKFELSLARALDSGAPSIGAGHPTPLSGRLC